MIRIAIKEAAFAAIAASLPKGRSAHAERPTDGKVFLWLEDAIVNQLAVPRRRGEGHRKTILRLFAAEKATKPKRARH